MDCQKIIKKFEKDKEGKEITKHEGNFSLLVWGTAPYLLSSPLFSRYYSEDFGSIVVLMGERKGLGFFDFENYRRSTEMTLKKYLTDKKKFTEMKDLKDFNKKIVEFYKDSHPIKLKDMKKEDLEKHILKAFELIRDWQVTTLFSEALDEEMVKKYFDEFSDNKTNFKEFFSAGSLIDFESFTFNINKYLLKLNETKNLYNIQWILSSYLATPSLEESKELIEKMVRDHEGLTKIKKEQENIQKEIKENKEKISKFRKELSGKLADLFDFVKLTMDLRDTRKEFMFRLVTVLSNSMREMFLRLDLAEEDIIYALFEDFVNKFYRKEEYKKAIEKRKKGYMVYYTKEGTEASYVEFEKGRNDLFKLMDGLIKDQKEIKGNIGCKGYAKAKAKIVLNKKDFSKFKKGDILITSMTRPEFVPLMKQASGVITDEGGITCHAAIVSRELNVPCIIGTKRATRILKDGDLVEVDADKGIVRILEKPDTKTLKLVADRARVSLYPWFFADECLTGSIENVIGEKIDKNILEFKKGHVYYYIDVDKFNKIGENLLNKIIDDPKFYSFVEKNILETGDALMEFCDNISKINLSNLSNKKLNDIYLDYAKKLKIIRAWGWIPPLLDGFTIPFLSDYLKEKFKSFLIKMGREKKLENYYAILSSSENKSEVQTEEVDRLKLISKVDKNLYKIFDHYDTDAIINKLKEKNPSILKLIINHAKKFNWLTYGYNGPPMNKNDVIKLIKISLKDNLTINEQLDKIKSHYKILRKEKTKIIKDLNLSKDLKYLFEVSSFFMYLKDLRKGIYQKSYVSMDPVMEEIAKRIKLSNQEILYLNRDEIREALIQNKDFKEIALERTKYCVALIQNGETKVYQNKEAREIIKKNTSSEKIDTNITELKGTVAYPGKLQGVAKIIEVVEDIPKINLGEVMISPTTNPDLIIAMKKARAFVTDMGGITSHAAIVAREMKKPCVVGTKIATKIIKDGDLVEVDAERGIVKIIKKKNGN